MIETTSHQLKPITISNQVRIVNPAILKVIANTIRQSVEGDTLTMKLRILFLDDLIRLFQSAHENRKIMLQQSVWQDWLLALGSLKLGVHYQNGPFDMLFNGLFIDIFQC